MSIDPKVDLTRRQWLSKLAILSASTLFGQLGGCRSFFQARKGDSNPESFLVGIVPFINEGDVPMNVVVGSELDGRLFSDLSTLTSDDVVTPIPEFYIRTRASQLNHVGSFSIIQTSKRANSSKSSFTDLAHLVKPQGKHLMECAGNSRERRFGLMSVADWSGISMSDVLDGSHLIDQTKRVLISGFDSYASPSVSSIPGASWIFTQEQLRNSAAFLATSMNGQPLTPDHGAPVRLFVPGWYGCACIKWVNEISEIDDTAQTTSQMREYAERTQQNGIPERARDYEPASVDPAAMPIRIEKWRLGDRFQYRVFGILWGGPETVSLLKIKFNPELSYFPVEHLAGARGDSWRFWTHSWAPQKRGTYQIQLSVADPHVITRRLNSGYYTRSVEILDA
jgi:Oxidoreductase molybdopterin binding domain